MSRPKKNHKTPTTKRDKCCRSCSATELEVAQIKEQQRTIEQRLTQVLFAVDDNFRRQLEMNDRFVRRLTEIQSRLRQVSSTVEDDFKKQQETNDNFSKRLAKIQDQLYKEPFWQPHRGKILWLSGVVATLGFNWIVFPQQVQTHWFNWFILSLAGWPLLLIWSVLHWLRLI